MPMSRSASEWTGDLPFRNRYRRQLFRPSDDDSKTTDSCNSIRGLTLPIKVAPGRMTPKTALIQGLAEATEPPNAAEGSGQERLRGNAGQLRSGGRQHPCAGPRLGGGRFKASPHWPDAW